MPILTFTFPGRRFHATPWGSHVNEGQVEWPPSPWRLCRALLATGLTKLGWREDQIPAPAIELLELLGGTLPDYQLPPSLTVAHSRHYMPISSKTTKVFDAFAHAGRRELRVSWPVKLTGDALALLGELVGTMSYLGRAESWVEGSVEAGEIKNPNCRPGISPELDESAEPVTLLAPMSSAAYLAWRSEQIATRPELAGGGKRSRRSAKPRVPAGLVGCLLQSTAELQRQGWNQPPGSRRVVYHRPSETLVASQPRRSRPRRSARPPVECVLLALRSHARHGGALPRLRHALKQMEIVHRALSKKLDSEGNGGPCPELLGTRGAGPLLKDHRHAHFIPLALGRARRSGDDLAEQAIDHVLIYAPGMLPARARRVLERLQWVRAATVSERHREREDDARARAQSRLTTTLAATGSLAELRNVVDPSTSAARIIGSGTRWISHTPFIAPRHVKKHKHSLIAQVRAELNARPEFRDVPVAIEILPKESATRAGFVAFHRRRRSGKPQPPKTRPWSIRLTFDRPITGPIALGYGSHFGLGLFRCEED